MERGLRDGRAAGQDHVLRSVYLHTWNLLLVVRASKEGRRRPHVPLVALSCLHTRDCAKTNAEFATISGLGSDLTRARPTYSPSTRLIPTIKRQLMLRAPWCRCPRNRPWRKRTAFQPES
jgi:hypothetical protein